MGDDVTYSTRRARRSAERAERRHGPFRSGFATLRDLLLFAAGMAILGHEVWGTAAADPAVIAVGLALTGAPLVLGADERRSG